MRKYFNKLSLRVKTTFLNFVEPLEIRLLSLTAPLWVRILKISAQTGLGADLCFEHGFLPLQVHYYSPAPDIKDLNQRQVWDNKSEMVGIDFRPKEQTQFLHELGGKYSDECNWPALPTSNPDDFYTENNSFSFGCVASLHSIIRYFQPEKILEIGSGNSSKVISARLLPL